MDYACPHCHELMRTDPANGRPPSMCPRCGGDIAIGAAPAAPSLATFLHSKRPETGAIADALPSSGDDAHDAGAKEAGMPTPEPTLEADAVAGTHECTDAAPGESTHPLATPAECPARARDAEPDAPGDERRVDSGTPTATDAIGSTSDAIDGTTNEALATQGEALAPAANTTAASTTMHEAAATPSFTQPARDSTLPPHTARWQWAALATLALVLVLQLLLADRARLAAQAQWRPLLASLCGVFGCSLPTWHEPDAFTMLSRDVRPVPGSTGALLVQATFRNDARWSQAWPVMRLSLSDADGRIVGARAFVPSEYLDAGATQATLAPGQSAQIMLQVREPEASVVAFSFDFD